MNEHKYDFIVYITMILATMGIHVFLRYVFSTDRFVALLLSLPLGALSVTGFLYIVHWMQGRS